jgi:hypothetical protein
VAAIASKASVEQDDLGPEPRQKGRRGDNYQPDPHAGQPSRARSRLNSPSTSEPFRVARLMARLRAQKSPAQRGLGGAKGARWIEGATDSRAKHRAHHVCDPGNPWKRPKPPLGHRYYPGLMRCKGTSEWTRDAIRRTPARWEQRAQTRRTAEEHARRRPLGAGNSMVALLNFRVLLKREPAKHFAQMPSQLLIRRLASRFRPASRGPIGWCATSAISISSCRAITASSLSPTTCPTPFCQARSTPSPRYAAAREGFVNPCRPKFVWPRSNPSRGEGPPAILQAQSWRPAFARVKDGRALVMVETKIVRKAADTPTATIAAALGGRRTR